MAISDNPDIMLSALVMARHAPKTIGTIWSAANDALPVPESAGRIAGATIETVAGVIVGSGIDIASAGWGASSTC